MHGVGPSHPGYRNDMIIAGKAHMTFSMQTDKPGIESHFSRHV